jgi:hypothetical protein
LSFAKTGILSVIGDYMPYPNARKLRTPKPKQIAPKAIILRIETKRKSFGLYISPLILSA